jgi:hypothetical protein
MTGIDTTSSPTLYFSLSRLGSTGVLSSYLHGVIRATILSLGAHVYVNGAALFIPEPSASLQETCTLSKKIAAIQLVPTGDGGGRARLGPVSQLLPGTCLQVCGQGFSEETIKVRSKDGFYFVFLQDIATNKACDRMEADQT